MTRFERDPRINLVWDDRVDFDSARRGMMLVDQYGQTCKVTKVDRRGRRIWTRRREQGVWWDGHAEWMATSFNGRPWFKVTTRRRSGKSLLLADRQSAKVASAKRRLRNALVGPLSRRLFHIAAAVKDLEVAERYAARREANR